MNKKWFTIPAVVFLVIAAGLLGGPTTAVADTATNQGTMPDSLHWTLRGMEYWYQASNDGLEQTTGIPYAEFDDAASGCMNCHPKDPLDPDDPADSCADSRCHGEYNPTGAPDWGTVYEMQMTAGQGCLKCHGREYWMMHFDDEDTTPDVHRDGVGTDKDYCTACHTTNEMHNIGTEDSLKEPGAMDTTCEGCHDGSPGNGGVPSSRYEHDTHTATLHCTACHQRRVTSCYNCHVDTAYESGVRQAKAKLTDWLFLMNWNGKVHSANMQTFIGGDNQEKHSGETTNIVDGPFDETALMFAPVHSHSIMNPGRACADCHGSANADDAYNNGALDLTWLDEYDALQHLTGMIPVGLNTSYNVVTFDKPNDVTSGFTWTAMDDGGSQSADARYHIAFGSPLSPAQMGSLAYSADPTTSYPDSLHETLRGMEYWYETGDSLDDMTGADYDDFTHPTAGCQNCHPTGTTSACEDARCHNGDTAPTGPPARTAAEIQTECLKCHGREGAMITYDAGLGTESVHRDGTGIVQYCTDCHSSREIHNVDLDYISLKEPGAMDTECANCHDPDLEGPGPVPPTGATPAPTYATEDQRTYAHTFHTKTLDCNACHQQHVTTCYNCHMDTAIDTGPRKAKGKIQDWLFLMNYDGKVTSANIQTFVGGDNSLKHPEGYNSTWSENDEVALMFAPVHSHSLTKYGRVCADCHQNATVADILADNELDLTWDDSGNIGHVTGLIPVAEDATYNVVAYDKDNTLESGFTWYANTPGAADHVFKIAYGSGLTANQMARLSYTANPAAEYPDSLHNQLLGMKYWYETGDSLDDMTGIGYDLFTHPTAGCQNCHPKADDPSDTSACQDNRCHGGDVDTPTTPPDLTASEIQDNCLACHGREKWMRIFDDNSGTPDVHRDGWNDQNSYCTDCHSSREIHAVDGVTDYDSLKEPGAMDTECANCHDAGTGPLPPESYAHSVHTATLDCAACHQRRVVSCYNCHVDTAYENGTRVAKAKLTDWLFLINYDGKVTSGNMQTFVGGDNSEKHPEGWNDIDGPNDEVALMFAPVHSHSIMKQGRACADCHRTDTVQELNAYGDMDLTWLNGDSLEHEMGVIPVAADATYNIVAFDKDNTLASGFTWYAMGSPPYAPDHQFEIAFGSALTADQMASLNYEASSAFEDFEEGIHNTYRGMQYWYETGASLDDIVGVPYDNFDHATQGCKNCHSDLPYDVNSGGQNCETCHGVGNTNPTGPPWVSDPDEIQPTCLKCHAREKVMKAEDDAAGTPDVHRAKGMTCMECHSSREVHNIGTEYESHKDIGAMDTECADCHTTGPGTPQPEDYSHSVHTATVDCSACHQRRVISCYNCHMDTAVDGPMRMARTKIKDWLFLMNYDGKVTAANMQSFVGGDNSVTGGPNTEWNTYDGKVLMFAPMYSHSTMKEGRTCEDCHGTTTVADIRVDSALDLTTTPDGGATIENVSGVIPVADATDYNLLWYDKDRTVTSGPTWWLLDTAPETGDVADLLICNGTALSSDQMDSLAMSGVGHGTHLSDPKGPQLTGCTDCHLAEEGGGVMNDNEPLATTTVCNICHSPDGAYDGVGDATIGCKANWDTGVYENDGTLQAGKEQWCATCHDNEPAFSQPCDPDAGGGGGAAVEVVVDNNAASYAGDWGTVTGKPCALNGDFRWDELGTGADTCTWTPDLPQAGSYKVYARWVAHSNRASDAPYTITYDGGSVTVDVDQQANGCQWNLLGTFPFAAGTGGTIMLSDDADEYVIADAVKLTLVDTSDMVLDNGEAAYSGTWSTVTGKPCAYAEDFQWNAPGDGDTCTWTPDIAEAGDYRVYARWVDHSNRASNAPYTITYSGGAETVYVDQRMMGCQWNLLGTYPFDVGTGGSIELSDYADGYLIADAIRVVKSNGCPDGAYAPDVASAYYSSGHKIECLSCHDAGQDHIDHQVRTYGSSSDNYRAGYRLQLVGGSEPMNIPRPKRTGDAHDYVADFALCFSCHNSAELLGTSDKWDASKTNFEYNDGQNGHFTHLVMGKKTGFDSDFNGVNDSDFTCTACHNVHGSSTPAMTRDGALIATTRADLSPDFGALNFSYLGSSTVVGSVAGQIVLGGGNVTTNGMCNAACHSSAVTCYRTAYIAPRVMPYPEIDAVFNDGVDTTLLTAYVLDHEPGTVPTVTVDGTDLGIGSQNMYDDGLTGGDLVAGDHIYTWETSTTAEASSKSLPVTATDADGTGTNDVAAKVLDEDTIVLDNSDATFGSSWPVITGSGCAYLGDFQYNLAGTGLDTATWRPTIYVTGTYDVYARWVNAGNRASDAPYTINHSAGSDTVDVDQRTDGCAWQLLGTYDFNAGTAGSIVLTDDADGIVIADGIMLELVP